MAKTKLTIVHKETNPLVIGEDVFDREDVIVNDFKKIIENINNITNHYSAIEKNKNSGAEWKGFTAKLVKTSKEYSKSLNSCKNTLDKQITRSAWTYIKEVMAELNKAENTANSVQNSVNVNL